MKEILLTSSVLILALLVLRRLFRRTVSRRVQYALWGLVLLRLLIPASLPAAGFSLLTAAEPAVRNLEAVYTMPEREAILPPENTESPYLYETSPGTAVGPASPDNTNTFTDRYGVDHVTRYSRQFSISDLLAPIWYGGMAAMACWLVSSNLSFWGKLRKRRKPFAVPGCKYPVYLIEEGLPSPCLFGLFRPAVYLTPAAASPERLRHVLAHEETHARHLDPLWSLLRGVCLTVYWFDPLVWWAALASRTDCELACDEGALRRLGTDQRIPYGQTLLSLVPVRKTPANPLLSATTMTAGKRQLKDRITRIAENRKTWGAALFAVIALTALVCAVTFTGAKAPEPEPLSEEEIAWFNEEFFNGEDGNIRDCFLTCVYESPQQIDLYQLFYYGTGNPMEFTEADRVFLEEHTDGLPFEDEELLRIRCSKIPVSEMESVLMEYTGIKLSEAFRDNLGFFWWSEENDAYYNVRSPYTLDENGMRMDGTYRMHEQVQIDSGEREGDLVRLYCQGEVYSVMEDSPTRRSLCVTLRKVGDGYHFVSNLPWNAPMVYPAAAVTISLDGLEPKDLQPAEPLTVSGTLQYLNTMDQLQTSDILDPYVLMFMTGDRGGIYAGVQNKLMSSLPRPFLEIPDSFGASYFQDVLGHDGFCIDYTGKDGFPVSDHYFLTKDGQPVLLARCGRDPHLIDLDGDGVRELTSCTGYGAQLVFQRDGQIYEADLKALVQEAWPEAANISFDSWDVANRCLGLSASVPYDTSDGPTRLEGVTKTAFRCLYYDGANLLLTEDPRSPSSEYRNHMVGRYDAPGYAVEAAQALAESAFNRRQSEGFDDWRVCTLAGPFEEIANAKRFEIWQTDYELHTPSPVVLSGSAHLSEPTWREARRPSYLVFQRNSDGSRTLAAVMEESDSAPGTNFFQISLLKTLTESGGVDLINLNSEELCQLFLDLPDQLLESVGALPLEVHRDLVLDLLSGQLAAAGRTSWEAVCQRMRNVQLRQGGSETWDTLETMVNSRMNGPVTPQEGMDAIMAGAKVRMTLLAPEGGGRYEGNPQAGNGPNRAYGFTSSYVWRLEGIGREIGVRSPIELTVDSEGGGVSFHFYPESSLVLMRTGQQDSWYSVTSEEQGDSLGECIFDFMRVWYDEAELAGLTADIAIPDRGRSREEIARAWAEAFEGAMMKATSGSEFACTYVRVETISLPDWLDGLSPEELDSFYLEETKGHERFAFSYTTVFVPENDRAKNCLMAGNTGEYTGGDAPAGALEYSRCGYLYLTEDGWRCDGVGTGW